jgi:ATP synthase protein I
VASVALGGYVFKIIVLLIVMISLKGVDALHPMSLALTVLAAVLVVAGLAGFRRRDLQGTT